MPDSHASSSSTTLGALDRLHSRRDRGPGDDFAAFGFAADVSLGGITAAGTFGADDCAMEY
ncbi:MAG: hypothetical protein D6798_07165 [Deltaproteobacteria bacterium]|nr:MAG: hypothetical protein D6798_07165 [Deltaproteobacteria bacterium]